MHLSLHLLAYAPVLLSRICYNVFVTYIRVLNDSHPTRQLENRRHHLKSNDITKRHFPPHCLTCQRICHSGSCSAGPCLCIFGVRCCSKPFANIQHPCAASFSKEDEQRIALAAVAFQEKVGAKAVKIALEELSLPTLPKLEFIFHLQLCCLLYVSQGKPTLSHAKLLLGEESSFFFWKKKVSALVPLPVEAWKEMTSPPNPKHHSKRVQSCLLEPQAEPCPWCRRTLQWRLTLLLLSSQRKQLQPGLLLPCTLSRVFVRSEGSFTPRWEAAEVGGASRAPWVTWPG